MKNQKIMAFALASISVFSASVGIAAFAKANDAAIKNASLENDFIRLTVEQDSSQIEYLRFCLDTNKGQTSSKDDDQKNLTYKNFYSGYTTLNINGENYIYGSGIDTREPKYDVESGSHMSSQKFGDVEIQQTLTFAEGFTSGYNDMLKITYTVLDSGENDDIGVRVLLDPMIEDDDDLLLSVNDLDISVETIFHKPVPEVWKADITADKDITAFGKNNTSDLNPDSLTFANWNSLYDNVWNTPFDSEKVIDDSGVAIKWEPVSVSANNEFTTYYGVKNNAVKTDGVAGKNNISSPKTSSSTVAGIITLFAASLVSAVGCILIGRKENNNNE